MDLAAIAHATTRERLARLADAPGADVRRGRGWTAIRTGVDSNDDNVVLSSRGAVIPTTEIDDLVDWMRDVPSSWLAETVDPALSAVLVERGARPERTGWWCGREVDPDRESTGWRVDAASGALLDDHLAVMQACGWFDAHERDRRRAQVPTHPLFRHVVARDGDQVVGAASGFAGSALEIVDIAVLPGARRRGIGGALVADLERWGRSRGTPTVFAAPSPDGAELFRALGFGFARVEPDVCFYLP